MSEYIVETEQVGAYTVKVILDQMGTDSPIEDEDSFTLAFLEHRNYTFGNERITDFEDWLDSVAEQAEPGFQDWAEEKRDAVRYDDYEGDRVKACEAMIAKRRGRILDEKVLMLPIHVYEHSGIAMTADSAPGYPFTCRWDSCQAGFIYITREKAREMMMTKRLTKAVRERVESTMRSVVSTYGAWVNGEVYGYVVEDEDGEEVDSCWGFIGDYDYALSEGRDMANWHIEQDQQRRVDYGARMSEATAASIGA